VVDDFESFRVSIRSMLRILGADQIDLAKSGEDALEKCAIERYDVVICDFNMGDGKNGQQVLEELRLKKRLTNTGLFVLVTAETSKDIVMGAREYLPDGYITKPITKALLEQRLGILIKQREDLLPINKEIDLENYPKAITLTVRELKKGSRYAAWCYKTLAELYYLTGDFTHAKKVYEETLAKRELTWASMGLGKVLLGEGKLDDAISYFKKIIEAQPDQVDAYDYLAEAYAKKGKKKDAQSTLEKAVSISPRGVPRQQKLGELSQENQDIEGAAKAFRATVKFGNHSVYVKPKDHLNLGRVLSDLSEGDTSKTGKKIAKEAIGVLDNASRKFNKDKDVKLQTLLIESRVHTGQNKGDAAERAFGKANKMIKTQELSADSGLEMAKTLYSRNETDEAEKLLRDLAQKFEGDKKILGNIEDLLDEPVSLVQKLKARELNKKGIGLFEQGKLDDAIATFNQALKATPKHPALNLNLVQVLLKKMAGSEVDSNQLKVCIKSLNNVKHIPSQHRQYKRYTHLTGKVDELKSKVPPDTMDETEDE